VPAAAAAAAAAAPAAEGGRRADRIDRLQAHIWHGLDGLLSTIGGGGGDWVEEDLADERATKKGRRIWLLTPPLMLGLSIE
jgi:hypothetical protein